MNGRVYDPAIGRFMSPDPFVVPMLGTQGLNRYAYTLNSPLSYTDPSGFEPWDDPHTTPGHDPGPARPPGGGRGGPSGGPNGTPGVEADGIVDPQGHVGVTQTESGIDVSTLVPGQNFSDQFYYPGYWPVARVDIGFASPALNGTFNLINGLGNAAVESFAFWTQPFDDYALDIITFESSFPFASILAPPSIFLGRLSASIRMVSAANREVFAARGATAIQTAYRVEVQATSAEALAALGQVRNGATVYRTGTLGSSMAGESQYWSLMNPASPGYASLMGVPAGAPNFVLSGVLRPGACVITNEAAALGANAGRGIQVVTEPGDVVNLIFTMQ